MMLPVLPRIFASLALLGAALLVSAATAQPLERLAPADAIVSLGLRPQENPLDTLPRDLGALDWQAAGAGLEALGRYLDASGGSPDALPGPFGDLLDDLLSGGGAMDEIPSADEIREELEAACPGTGGAADLALHDADELLLTVGMSPFRPLPAGVLLARVRDSAVADLAELYARLTECAPGEPLRQGDVELHVFDGGDLPIVLAHVDDLLVLGSDPEAVRGVLRRVEGEEGGLAERPVGAALAAFDQDGFRIGVDTAAIAEAIDRTLPAGMTGDPLEALVRERGLDALRTLGGVAMRVSLTPDGVEAETFMATRTEGPDEDLAALLRCEGCRASGPFLIPRDAVSASGMVVPLRGWIAYVDGWLADLDEAGAPVPPDVRTALREAAGVDLDAALLDWIGEDVQSARLQPISPDLRRLIYQPASITTVSVRSAEDAERGVEILLDALRDVIATVDESDAELWTQQVLVRERAYQGTRYRRVQIGPNADVGVGVIGNRLVLAAPSTAIETVVDLSEGGGGDAFADEVYAELRDEAPEDLTSWTYGRPGADIVGLADTLEPFAQPLASVLAGVLAELADEGGDAPFGGDPFGEDPSGGSDGAVVPMGDGVDPAAVDPAPLAVPGDVEAELGAGGAATTEVSGKTADVYRLEGLEAGTSVAVEMTSDPIDTYLYRLDPQTGAVLDSNDDAPDTSRSELVFVAPAGQQVWIAASSFGFSSSGSYRLSVSTGGDAFSGGDFGSFDPAAHAPVTLDVPGGLEARLGDEDETEVDGRRSDVYALRGVEPGATLTVEMTSDPVDTYLYWLDPDDGRIRDFNDDAPFTSRSEITLTVPEHGRVWIAAASYGSGGEGPYTLNVTAAGGLAPDDADEAPEQPAETDGTEAPDAQEPGAANEDLPHAESPPDENGEDAEAPVPPGLADLLPVLEIGPRAVRVIGEHVGPSIGWSVAEEEGVRTVRRLRIDW